MQSSACASGESWLQSLSKVEDTCTLSKFAVGAAPRRIAAGVQFEADIVSSMYKPISIASDVVYSLTSVCMLGVLCSTFLPSI